MAVGSTVVTAPLAYVNHHQGLPWWGWVGGVVLVLLLFGGSWLLRRR